MEYDVSEGSNSRSSRESTDTRESINSIYKINITAASFMNWI